MTATVRFCLLTLLVVVAATTAFRWVRAPLRSAAGQTQQRSSVPGSRTRMPLRTAGRSLPTSGAAVSDVADDAAALTPDAVCRAVAAGKTPAVEPASARLMEAQRLAPRCEAAAPPLPASGPLPSGRSIALAPPPNPPPPNSILPSPRVALLI